MTRWLWLRRLLPFLLVVGGITAAAAGEADVLRAEIQPDPAGGFNITVTVLHADEGWTHYADRWEVLDSKGQVIATRELAHPHVNEQPFTRSLQGVDIPDGVTKVTIRARDSRHGYGGKTVEIEVPRDGQSG